MECITSHCVKVLALQAVSSKSALSPHTLVTLYLTKSTHPHIQRFNALSSFFLRHSVVLSFQVSSPGSPPLSSSVPYRYPHIPPTTTIKRSRKLFPNNDRSMTRCHPCFCHPLIQYPKYRNPLVILAYTLTPEHGTRPRTDTAQHTPPQGNCATAYHHYLQP
jgi:hypothetical protein